ncbi:hypothetical protein ACFOZY_09215 [Chungangia koreensis]|uniref:Uncharacterized protein n=1 Tax=Chungangia koreensis TaxID=752657 RepID=A0ABV8X6L0_9LACT
MAQEMLYCQAKDIQYPGRSTGHIRRASDIVGNDLLVQKAIAKYYGLKK